MLDVTIPPNRKQKHNAKVRARILAAAGETFRTKGYEGAGIDALMAEAGLTRGAFYAHFMSKEALFVEVLSEDDPLLEKLKSREGRTPLEMWREMNDIFNEYLDPSRKRRPAKDLNLVAFSHDASRVSDAARMAYQAAFDGLLREMTRGLPIPDNDARVYSALSMIVATLSMVNAFAIPAKKREMLEQGRIGFSHFSRRIKREIVSQSEGVDVPEKTG